MEPVPAQDPNPDRVLEGQAPKVLVPLWSAMLLAVIAPVPLFSDGPGGDPVLGLAVAAPLTGLLMAAVTVILVFCSRGLRATDDLYGNLSSRGRIPIALWWTAWLGWSVLRELREPSLEADLGIALQALSIAAFVVHLGVTRRAARRRSST